MTAYAIRKGQFCAVGERLSSTLVSGATTSAWTYTIGRVAKADAKGTRIREASVSRYGTEIRLREDMSPRFWQSWAIRPDLQTKAAALLEREFASIDDLRGALGVGRSASNDATREG